MAVALLFVGLTFTALPPGIQDKLLCPCGYCKSPKKVAFSAGPQASFVECTKEGSKALPVKTWGSRVNTDKQFDDWTKAGYHEVECTTKMSDAECASREGGSFASCDGKCKKAGGTPGEACWNQVAGSAVESLCKCGVQTKAPACSDDATTPSSAKCESWCASHAKAWPKKCAWKKTCGGCPACSGETTTAAPAKLVCKKWCGSNSKDWPTKCAWKKICDGCAECSAGPCICTKEYKPVCGSDGKVYSNECTARCAKVKSWTSGKCKSPCICPMIYGPVCGSNGKTYDNDCFAACAKVKSWTSGKCKVKPITTAQPSGTKWCPNTIPLVCKIGCPKPKCDQGHCADRLDKCGCAYKCKKPDDCPLNMINPFSCKCGTKQITLQNGCPKLVCKQNCVKASTPRILDGVRTIKPTTTPLILDGVRRVSCPPNMINPFSCKCGTTQTTLQNGCPKLVCKQNCGKGTTLLIMDGVKTMRPTTTPLILDGVRPSCPPNMINPFSCKCGTTQITLQNGCPKLVCKKTCAKGHECPTCGTIKKSSTRSCCGRGGSWFGKCGKAGDSTFEHTWFHGAEACKQTATPPPATTQASACPTCGKNKVGKRSCCGRGGSWFGKCGDPGDATFDHTWGDGMLACKQTMPTPASVCPKCGTSKAGKRSCCAPGGSWVGKCGDPGDATFEYTWFDGVRVCKGSALPVNMGQGSAAQSEEGQGNVFRKQTTPPQVETVYGTNDGMETYVDSGDCEKLTILIGVIICSINILI